MLPFIGAAIGALASNANTSSAIAANKQEAKEMGILYTLKNLI